MNLPFIRINPLGVVVLCTLVLFLIYLYTTNDGKRENETQLISLKHLLAVSVNAAELGGSKVRDVRKSSDLKKMSKGKTEEGANDPLTYGDLLSHRAMLHTLKKSFPNIQIVSEEDADKETFSHDTETSVSSWIAVDTFEHDILVPEKDILIWIDPLDATQEYTENLLEYVTTLVCVAVRGKPILGVIHKPFQNITIWAWDGHGVSNQALLSSAKQNLNKSPTIIVSRSHSGKVEEVAKSAFGLDIKIIKAGGAGFKSIMIAEGKADAYIHVSLIKKWDICAGNALLNTIGGKMTSLSGTPIDYGNANAVKNEKGLLATMHDHEEFVTKLSSLTI